MNLVEEIQLRQSTLLCILYDSSQDTFEEHIEYLQQGIKHELSKWKQLLDKADDYVPKEMPSVDKTRIYTECPSCHHVFNEMMSEGKVTCPMCKATIRVSNLKGTTLRSARDWFKDNSATTFRKCKEGLRMQEIQTQLDLENDASTIDKLGRELSAIEDDQGILD